MCSLYVVNLGIRNWHCFATDQLKWCSIAGCLCKSLDRAMHLLGTYTSVPVLLMPV